MENKLGKTRANTRKNILQMLQYREVNGEAASFTRKYCQFTYELIQRLGCSFELEGHQGCVNCLEWTADGSILASGSDDTKVILWDPVRRKQIHTVATNHFGNIFSVKFLGINNSLIATAAGDCRVLVQSITDSTILECNCHKHRVKRLATSPLEPVLFWSAGEDGLVMQYDLRESHDCSASNANLLISYGTAYEAKCIAVNPTKPHYIAVGTNDAFVRVYDRRKMTTCSISEKTGNEFHYPPIKSDCVQYYAPGHLAFDNYSYNNYRFTATYIAYNAAGSEMLVNMGGEQIYLFDVNHQRPVNAIAKLLPPKVADNVTYKCKCNLEDQGDQVKSNYGSKINTSEEPCGCFYMRRGFHLNNRKWIGDLYCAARDYLHVMQLWPNETQAYVGLIKSLVRLRWADDARRWLNLLCQLQPEFASQKQARTLRDVIALLEENNENPPEQNAFKLIETEEANKRFNSIDYEMRFMGHCNTTTDIKEANFLGEDGHYICAGSDEGIIFIWERKTQSIVNALVGDVSIVNCIQPHPNQCLIASSGIDPVVKLWTPMAEDGSENSRRVKDIESVVQANQQRMAMDPFESLLVNMGYEMHGGLFNPERAFEDLPQCRTS
ncbi:unnamed protein product [Ceutorhynchus assimilis]|uniref:WD and tetratricopeptide repeats protein 1 n=1 Tax=Ceutorhynchus assimilis TaxID=467358 RepID=A0A9N9MWS9_9CUCU|nr:unnamed protein product [Ceutorhynchus assimilis]